MSDTALSYPVDARNRVRRHHERGAYDHDAVHAVLDAGMLCHVAYVFDGQPYCTPTLHWREGEMLYWHGSSASRMLRGQRAGVPVCVTVSHLDGIVLARRGLNHSANYRAAMCFGTARIVDDPAEKAQALAAVIDRFLPGRSGRVKPNTAQEAKATTVIGMRIAQASAKVRAAGVGDEPEDLDLPIWAGVIPVRTVIGAVETSPHVPEGVARPPELAHYPEGETLDKALRETQRIYEGG